MPLYSPAQALSSGAMSALPSPADHKPGAGGLVEMERELVRLLIEYDELEAAWPKGGHVLVRAEIGRQVADALACIEALENDILATPARTPAGAAVWRRSLAALSEAGIIPCDPFWPRPWRRWKRRRLATANPVPQNPPLDLP